MPSVDVHAVRFDDPSVVWDFDTSAPRWTPRVGDRYLRGAGTTLDPFPGYAHDATVTRAAAVHVAACWEPRWDIHLYLADREHVGRSNAYSTTDEGGHYADVDGVSEWVKDPPTGVVFMAGKRIMPHPGMTRHLVAHEYGHHVEWFLQEQWGEKHHHTDAVVNDYAERRGGLRTHHGTGGRWHDSAHEVFACDFRIIVCDVEAEYWPHPGVPHPHEVPGLAEWWIDALERTSA